MNEHLAGERRRLRALRASYAFRRPELAVDEARQRLDDLDRALGAALGRRAERAAGRLDALGRALPAALATRRQRAASRAERALLRLRSAGRALTPERAARLDGFAGRLDALGPGQVLRRGYALIRRPDGTAVTGVAGLQPAARIRLDFHDGHAAAEVRAVVAGESLVAPATRLPPGAPEAEGRAAADATKETP